MVPTISVRPVLILAILFLSSAALAQYGASLQGTILDKSGAAVVGATVTVTNQATGVSRNTISSDSGFYRIAGLPQVDTRCRSMPPRSRKVRRLT